MTETTQTEHTVPAGDFFDRWTTMWNSDGEIAREICGQDFRIHFAVTEPDGSTPADDIRTAEDFVRYLAWWHGQNPGVVFSDVGSGIDHTADGTHGRLLWNMAAGSVRIGGIDVFDFDADGRVRRVWSAGGQRSWPTD